MKCKTCPFEGETTICVGHDYCRGEYPTIKEQVYNFAESTIKVIKGVFQGNPGFVDKITADKRLAICEQCPENHFDAEQKRCRECGCWMESKVTLEAMKCRHWGES